MKILASGKSAYMTEFAAHSHPFWELVINIEGEGLFTAGGRDHLFRRGSVACVPPGVEHKKRSRESFRDIWVQCSGVSELDNTDVSLVEDNAGGEITALMSMLWAVRCRQEPNYVTVAEALLESVVQMVISRLDRKTPDPNVERIVNRIIAGFQDPDFSLDACLSGSGYCADHMRRRFREEMGRGPHEYLTDLRIKTAKKLLMARGNTQHTVADIAGMVGFSDVCYFSRLFKKATGVSPGKYTE